MLWVICKVAGLFMNSDSLLIHKHAIGIKLLLPMLNGHSIRYEPCSFNYTSIQNNFTYHMMHNI